MAIDRGDDNEIPPQLRLVLAGFDARAMEDITKVVVLHREFPEWAVWLPDGNRPWTAVRPASRRAPTPDLPMIWVHAPTAASLYLPARLHWPSPASSCRADPIPWPWLRRHVVLRGSLATVRKRWKRKRNARISPGIEKPFRDALCHAIRNEIIEMHEGLLQLTSEQIFSCIDPCAFVAGYIAIDVSGTRWIAERVLGLAMIHHDGVAVRDRAVCPRLCRPPAGMRVRDVQRTRASSSRQGTLMRMGTSSTLISSSGARVRMRR